MTEKGSIFEEYCKYLETAVQKYGTQTIVLMQVGMFHELYGIDNEQEKIGYVKEISEILNIQMTRRDKKIPENSRKNFLMAGFPSVSLDRYVNVLLDNNYTVAIVDQITEPPKVERKVTKIYSPGTTIEDLRNTDNNYLLAVYFRGEKDLLTAGLSAVDLSTGESHICEAWSTTEDTNYALDEAYRFIQSYQPREIILHHEDVTWKTQVEELLDLQQYTCHIRETIPKDYKKLSFQNLFLKKVFKSSETTMGVLSPIEWLDLENKPLSVLSFLLLLQFAWEHNEKIVEKLRKPEIWEHQRHLVLANNAINQLALIDSACSSNSKYRSVFHIINKTTTPMGKRLLKHRLLNPIIDSVELQRRYNLITLLKEKISIPDLIESNQPKEEYKYKVYEDYLRNLIDLERYHRKISLKLLQPFEFNILHTSYQETHKILEIIEKDESLSRYLLNDERNKMQSVVTQLKEFMDYYGAILNLKETSSKNLLDVTDSFFRVGYNPELDQISYKIKHYEHFFKLIARELSDAIIPGSDAVKLKFSESSGYYLILTLNRYKILQQKYNSSTSIIKLKVDDKVYELDFNQDFTMEKVSKVSTSCNLFSKKLREVTNELLPLQKEIREKVKMAYYEFLESLDTKWHAFIEQISKIIAQLDVAKSGAKTSILYFYNAPEIIRSHKSKSFIDVKEIRHPIIERINQAVTYVPHDVCIGKETDKVDGILLYGVNSCGKSSLMKALGINLVLAQAGMFVAAREFKYYPYQYVLTRIIGNDNLFKGLSSFAVEMAELRGILKRANAHSLILGDEICHGTETISAVAIVASAIIHLAKKKSSFVFATHLHQLANIEEIKDLSNIKNFHLRVQYDEKTGELVYDRKLNPGTGDPIYGLEVAKAMQLDHEFLNRANKIRRKLLKVDSEVLNCRKSHFNPEIILDLCRVCSAKAEETHHIEFQCTANVDNLIRHFHKNSTSNLVPLCHTCHQKVHVGDKKTREKLVIRGYRETSSGLVLDYSIEKMANTVIEN